MTPPEDVANDADAAEERFAHLLADWDERHVSGKSTAAVRAAGETPTEAPADDELQSRLERAQACLQLLKQVWPEPIGPRPAGRKDGRAYARFGRYEIVRELGRGGHGVVFLATDSALKRPIALKLPRPEVLASEELRQRFMREAEAAARLDHPNILPVFEVGSEGPIPFTAAAFCDGGTLQDWLALGRAPLPPREAAQIVAELAAAVHHAHSRGVLHRDLKPSNVLLLSRDRDAASQDGSVPAGQQPHSTPPPGPPPHDGPLLGRWVPKIADFGLAKLVGGDQDTTMNGVIMGTANYMAPEQAAGRTADIGVATDVYSLGIILYELLTGAPPFLAASNLATLQRVERDEAAWPSKVRASIPRDLRTVCLQCLEKDPGQRYPSAAALAADLRHFLMGEPVSARPQSVLERARRLIQRHPALSVLSAMAACLAIGFVVQLDRHNRDLTGLNAQLALKISEQEKATARSQRLQRIAEERAEENRRRSFGAKMRLVQQFGDAGSLRQMTEALHETIPKPEEQDLREFAWRYWWNRCRRAEYFVLPGHGTFVYDAAYSPDGRWIATSSSDATVRVWETETGRELVRLRGMQEEAQKVAFSPDGKLLAAGDRFGTVKLWSTENWQVRHALAAHASAVIALGFGLDDRLVTGGQDAAIRVWNTKTGKMIDFRPLSNGRDLTALAVVPRKNLVVAGTSKGEIQFRSLSDINQLIENVRTDQASIHGLAVNPSGDRMLSSDAKGNLRLWQIDNRSTVFKSPQNVYPHSPTALSADGRLLAAVTGDGEIQILDAASGEVRHRRKLDMDFVGGLGFSPNGDAVLVAGTDGQVAFWQPFEPQPASPQGHAKETWSVAFAEDGLSFITGSDDETIVEWETASGRKLRTICEKLPGTVSALAWSPGGSLVASTSLEEVSDLPDNVCLWKMPDAKPWRLGPAHSTKPFSAAFHPGGRVLATGAQEVILWDVKSGLQIDQLNDSQLTGKKVKSIAFSRDGALLAFASEDRHVYVYEFPSLKRRFALSSGNEVWCVAFSPDGQSLAAGNKDGDVTIWNPHTGAARCSLRGHLQGVRCVAFTHDGQTIATGSEDKTIKLWGPVTGQEFCTLSGHADHVYCLAFSPDDQWLASGSHDGAVKLWPAPRRASLADLSRADAKENASNATTPKP